MIWTVGADIEKKQINDGLSDVEERGRKTSESGTWMPLKLNHAYVCLLECYIQAGLMAVVYKETQTDWLFPS